MLINYFHLFLCVLLFSSCFFVCISESSIQSVLFLILSFCNASMILFLFNVEFLGLLFIIIYVGAIAVLFLFIIMMLNIKFNIYKNEIYNYKKIYFLILFILFMFCLFQLTSYLSNIYFKNSLDLINQKEILFIVDNLNNIDILGQALYNNFIICFLLAGLILLVALIGSVVLTLKFDTTKKHQISLRQLSRSDKFLSFFYQSNK